MNTLQHIARRARGFSLIELMVTLAVSGIVATVVFGAMLSQQQGLLLQFQRTESQQNARVSLEVIKRHLRLAGWGFAAGRQTGTSALVVGSCDNSADQLICNNLDAGSDRLRIYYIEPDIGATPRGYAAGVTTDPMLGSSTVPFIANMPGHTPPLGNIPAIISGECAGGGVANDLLDLSGLSGTDYSFSAPADFSCDYTTGFNFGRAVVEDFFIDRTDALHPTLSYRRTTDGSSVVHVIAHDVEHLQVRYGLDTATPPTQTADTWCDDPRQIACNTPLGVDPANFYRIVAVQVAVVARTREPRAGYAYPGLQVLDHPIPSGDGYRRWTFRTTIALRNVRP